MVPDTIACADGNTITTESASLQEWCECRGPAQNSPVGNGFVTRLFCTITGGEYRVTNITFRGINGQSSFNGDYPLSDGTPVKLNPALGGLTALDTL